MTAKGHNRGFNPAPVFAASQRMHRRGHKVAARLLQSLNFIVFRAILPPGIEGGEGLGLNHRGLNVVVHPHVTLGRNVQIQHGVTLATDRPLTSGLRMVIGDNVKIGACAILLGPIHVGDRAIIGAGSVVTKNVPAGEVWAGNPARQLRRTDADR